MPNDSKGIPITAYGTERCDFERFPGFEVVAYHDNCTDGIAAAAVIDNFSVNYQSEFIPVQYGQPLPQRILDGANNPGGAILFVDFCPELEQIQSIKARWNDWFVIDHHKSREWLLERYPWHAFYDLSRSGAVLTWNWLSNDIEDTPVMLHYVQDRDLWKWDLRGSREVSAALGEEPKTLERWRNIIWDDPKDYIEGGRVLLTSRTRHAASLAKKAFLVGTAAGTIRACNATENMSEVGEEILKRFSDVDVACAFFFVSPTEVQLSFRSRAHQPADVNALLVASSFTGGGGHTHASGARVPAKFWVSLLEESNGHL